MVIFEDFRKLLIYEQLNRVLDCQVCKKKFTDRFEYLQHIIDCKGQLKCSKCGKVFGHQQILQLHMRFHNLSQVEDCQLKTQCNVVKDTSQDKIIVEEKRTTPVLISDNPPEENHTSSELFITGEEEKKISPITNKLSGANVIDTSASHKKQPSHKTKTKSKSVKKKVGLTKIKMEDCLRCDDCSCIYIDKDDYYKHMRNFHQLDVNNMPIIRKKTKRKCRSCCKQCRGANCIPVKKPRATRPASNLIFKINMRDNIKDRWTKMISQQLSECPMVQPRLDFADPEVQIKPDPDSVTIKTEPEDQFDISHLLSQVEVKIKTEPSDD